MIFQSIQLFFKALCIKDELLINLAIDIKYHPEGETKEKVILTEDEMIKFLEFINCSTYILKKKGVTCHSIRHSSASHLLDKGADLRYVQTLLGHESIETTVVYTHLLTDSMKRIYKSYHPREINCFEELDNDYLTEVYKLENSINKQKEMRNWRRAK